MFKVTKIWTWTLKATLWESQDTSLTLSNCLFHEKAIKNMYKIQKSSQKQSSEKIAYSTATSSLLGQ